jgi:hypothetical protein
MSVAGGAPKANRLKLSMRNSLCNTSILPPPPLKKLPKNNYKLLKYLFSSRVQITTKISIFQKFNLEIETYCLIL